MNIEIHGRTYDLNDLPDSVKVQNMLCPENWPGTKKDAVRHFLALRSLVMHQLGRHFAANFKKIAQRCMEEAEEQQPARVSIGFSFEVDMSAPTVAALAAHKMSFSVKHETKGKPQTIDLNQEELPLGENIGGELDPHDPEPPPEEEQTQTPDESAVPPPDEPPADGENKVEKKSRRKKK